MRYVLLAIIGILALLLIRPNLKKEEITPVKTNRRWVNKVVKTPIATISKKVKVQKRKILINSFFLPEYDKVKYLAKRKDKACLFPLHRRIKKYYFSGGEKARLIEYTNEVLDELSGRMFFREFRVPKKAKAKFMQLGIKNINKHMENCYRKEMDLLVKESKEEFLFDNFDKLSDNRKQDIIFNSINKSFFLKYVDDKFVEEFFIRKMTTSGSSFELLGIYYNEGPRDTKRLKELAQLVGKIKITKLNNIYYSRIKDTIQDRLNH
jgi:hypothetical protein